MAFLKGLLKNYRLIILIVSLAVGCWGMYKKPAFIERFALGFEDIKFPVRSSLGMAPEPDKRLVIVTVDEPSVNKLGRWVWPRDVIAKMFSNLSQADIVGLDIVFSEPSDEKSDELLADSIINSGNIILGFFFRGEATEETTEQAIDYLENCAYLNYDIQGKYVGVKEFKFAEVNIPIIAESGLTCASFSTEPDVDGLYRNYPLAYIHKGYIFPPLAVQMMRYGLDKDAELVLNEKGVKSFKIDKVNLKNSSYFRLNYYDNVEYVSAYKVINGEIPPSFFKDKMVIVGVTEVGIYDMRPTPVDAVTPGVSLHYAALSNLLNNEFLTTSDAYDYASIVVLMLVILAISYLRKQHYRLMLYFGSFTLTAGVSYAMFIFGNHWQHEFYTMAPAILMTATLESFAFFTVERKAKEVKKAFASYVSPELVEEIQKDPDKLKLGGEERFITIMFSDIRGFTTLSEKLSATELTSMLNKIHDPMTKVVLSNKGMLDKYIGDAMMALFNTPLDLPDHADMAVKTALELIRTLHEINGRFTEAGLPNIDVGVGVNSGPAVCGNMGSTVRFEYTAIGDSVNIASRLEGLCKAYKTRIVVSEYTLAHCKMQFLTRKLDSVRVKGKKEPVAIYEVMENTPENKAIADRFHEGLDMYFARNFEGALAVFEEMEAAGDATSSVFTERCREYIKEPPESDWDGTYTMKTK
ncbi:CHASE2 domain-containing protein [Seleniivibrio woodruffii]|uniref:CHASE2 domain-containing protein n=1 Tax=Seleniivibrio woodruffii TaxID=1078050 RepID=UPI002409066A|nr:adenylate/guanylate cyclase domain-containing protein [Seleniivibrio woodruffii]